MADWIQIDEELTEEQVNKIWEIELKKMPITPEPQFIEKPYPGENDNG